MEFQFDYAKKTGAERFGVRNDSESRLAFCLVRFRPEWLHAEQVHQKIQFHGWKAKSCGDESGTGPI